MSVFFFFFADKGILSDIESTRVAVKTCEIERKGKLMRGAVCEHTTLALTGINRSEDLSKDRIMPR